jgi:hypothetical protein
MDVDAWHAAGLRNGGSCEGAPGVRNVARSYVAYLRDPVGNKLSAKFDFESRVFPPEIRKGGATPTLKLLGWEDDGRRSGPVDISGRRMRGEYSKVPRQEGFEVICGRGLGQRGRSTIGLTRMFGSRARKSASGQQKTVAEQNCLP